MRFRRWAVGLVAAFLCGAAAPAPHPAKSVVTPGEGILNKCRSVFMGIGRTCNTYHHVALPRRIDVGDKVPIVYGSNRKEYGFPVFGISLAGDSCTIFGEDTEEDDESIDKLVVTPCRPAPRL